MEDRPWYRTAIRRSINLSKELDLLDLPESMDELFRLFSQSEGQRTVMWIGAEEDCFISNYKFWRPRGFSYQFQWSLTKNSARCQKGIMSQDFYVCTETLERTMSCMDSLAELSMDKLSSSVLSWTLPDDEEERICPFGCEMLEKFILQNQKGRCGFKDMTFTPSQSRILATTGEKTHLSLLGCKFQDEGIAFMKSYLAPEKHNAGPVRLDFRVSTALCDTILIACLDKLQELRLSSVRMSPDLSSMIVSAELNYLELDHLTLDDEAQQVLINNIRQGRGPKGISLELRVLGSKQNFVDFCNALSSRNGHEHLTRLKLSHVYATTDETNRLQPCSPQVENALLAALSGNVELTSFGLSRSHVTDNFWNSLLKLRNPIQPSLRKLCFTNVTIHGGRATRKERTEQLAHFILAHEYIEQMEFCAKTFDEEVWEKRVIPALQHNEYRERFAAVQRIQAGYTREAILAEAVKKVNDRPSLLFKLLHQNFHSCSSTETNSCSLEESSCSLDASFNKSNASFNKFEASFSRLDEDD